MLQRASIFIFLLFTISLNSTYGMDIARYADSLEREANKTTDVKKQVELLLAATKQLKFYDLERALSMANRALSLATNANMPELQLQAMIDVGNINTYKTQFTAGMEMALKAKEIASPLDLKNVLGEASLIIGMIKIFQADYGDSYEAYFEALRYFEQCNSQEGIVVALNGIGNICYYQRNFTKADIYYSQALKKAREIRDTFQIANVLNNVGLVLVERSQVEKAIGCYQEAIGIHKSLGLKLRLATNYINLSIAYLTMNRFDDFNSNYSMAFEIYASLGSRQNQAMCYLMYYDYCKQINDSENQLKYAMMAYGDGVKYNLRSVVSQAAEVLHEFYLSAGKIDSAYKYAMIWNAEKDSIDNEQATARLTLLEMEYTYDKQQKEANIKQQRKDFITIILIILGTSALITTILFLSRQIVKTKNIRLEKQRLSDVVEFKDKELTLNVMNLIKKNEIFVDLSNRLIQMEQKTTDPAMKQEIIQLINSLQRNSSQEMWEEFEVRFRQVHNSYYEKLLVRFPELSPSELKLCALLRLNLSTKEICELSGQRPSTLDVARYRLRKKLGLSNSQVNLVTFLSQV